MAFLIGGANSAADTGYTIDNSCRFGGTNNEYMDKTIGTPSNTKKMTWSVWVKKEHLNDDGYLATVYTDGSNYGAIIGSTGSADAFQVFQYISGSIQLNLITTQAFRDPSAWSHFVVQMDTTQSTASDRCKIWHNGVRITSFATETYWAQNTVIKMNEASQTLKINAITTSSQYHGYVADFVMCDGQTYQASDFGEYDENSPTIWKPKDPTDLTFGTNGFWLDFEDSANLGNDANGGTDFSETNFAAIDQTTDTPTNNFCTLNPLSNRTSSGTVTAATFSEGNCKADHGDANTVTTVPGTMGVSSGKWYFEVKVDDAGGDANIGVISASADLNGQQGTTGHPSIYYGSNGKKCYNVIASNDGASFGDTYTDDDIISVALDLDNNVIWFAKNGTWQDSGDPTSGATATGAAFSGTGTSDGFPTTSSFYLPVTVGYNSFIASANFGNPPYANSSSVADANGYGAFEYAPPTGFLALCTKNLGSSGG